MTRIDDALRRARGDMDEADDAIAQEESPWTFGDDRAIEQPAPAAPPIPASSRRLQAPADDLPEALPRVEPLPQDDLPFLESVAGNEKLVGGALPKAMVEEYRKLAASLHQAQLDRGLQVLLVASAVPGEGKTLTAANLALTLSLSYGRRTLLVDADLRRPSMHTLFKLPVTSGLSEGLSAEDAVRVSAVQISRLLAVLPAGRPAANPVPLLTSARMQQLIADARQHFDWVIIDTPPVALLTDTNLLATMADASLLVISAGHTQHPLVAKAVETLGRSKIFGVVLNMLPEHPTLSGASYKGYYSDYLPAQR
jgi:protein-tyrosine kinase